MESRTEWIRVSLPPLDKKLFFLFFFQPASFLENLEIIVSKKEIFNVLSPKEIQGNLIGQFSNLHPLESASMLILCSTTLIPWSELLSQLRCSPDILQKTCKIFELHMMLFPLTLDKKLCRLQTGYGR